MDNPSPMVLSSVDNIIKPLSYGLKFSGQSYKTPTVVIYVSRVVNISNLLVSTTLEARRGFICHLGKWLK